jgi:molybdenum cofactor cytidylyltransferase
VNKPLCSTAILLAAGGSTRLGRPKQLLSWNGTTLLGSTIKSLVIAGCERLIVVLGAYESEVRKHCVVQPNIQLDIVTNVDWSQGQATSLRVGIDQAIASKSGGATTIALCDQPLIDFGHYLKLSTQVSQFGSYAAATEYPEGLGVPACFNFSALQSLSLSVGDTGAKKWLREQAAHIVSRVSCPGAILDIDTEIDYRQRMYRERFI